MKSKIESDQSFESIGWRIPKILLPRVDVDPKKWACVACDQYTSQPAFWEGVAKDVGNSPSCFHLIYPEVYLHPEKDAEYVTKINRSMETYEKDGVLVESEGIILVDRASPSIASRKGLIVSLDLEKYNYNKGAKSLIRATEATILSRLPARIKIREAVNIELPHIMVLYDDEEDAIMKEIWRDIGDYEKKYDFEMAQGAGKLQGWLVDDGEKIKKVAAMFEKLLENSVSTYGQELLYAMGDGNHSLATAKACYDKLKEDLGDAALSHPARYALCELTNLHDAGTAFEPIHRLLLNVDGASVLEKYRTWAEGKGMTYKFHENGKLPLLEHMLSSLQQYQEFTSKSLSGLIEVGGSDYVLSTATLQDFLDTEVVGKSVGGDAAEIDYIHGDDVIKELSKSEKACGFLVPCPEKNELFKTIVKNGALPRKTFSMGHAIDKRFYFECRKIVP